MKKTVLGPVAIKIYTTIHLFNCVQFVRDLILPNATQI